MPTWSAAWPSTSRGRMRRLTQPDNESAPTRRWPKRAGTCHNTHITDAPTELGRGLVGAPRRCSLQNQFNRPTAGPSRIVPLQFISGDRDCSFLVRPYPVRERAVFDFEREFV